MTEYQIRLFVTQQDRQPISECSYRAFLDWGCQQYGSLREVDTRRMRERTHHRTLGNLLSPDFRAWMLLFQGRLLILDHCTPSKRRS